MSRVGKAPIPVPVGVAVTIEKNEVSVKGPKGELKRSFHPDMSIVLEDGILKVMRPDDERLHRAIHGLTRTLLANMVQGVTQGFDKGLEITGVGYRAEKAGNNLVLRVGFTRPVEVVPMPGIAFALESPTRVKVTGIDKEVVGEMASRIRGIRPPDVYRGKGIKYSGEVVRHKAGKAAKAIGGKG
ncbi:MAG: 50S ribosomal protein L6 [Chloroflexi bacterium RBG_16_57_8]|nr:MAG: 50S ribosomal protein L6 [Chloroflexi bacterium RBG_16_57_8]